MLFSQDTDRGMKTNLTQGAGHVHRSWWWGLWMDIHPDPIFRHVWVVV